jgi:hypothetical protein
MNAKQLNLIGLVLGLISGLLLIPELFNLIPLNKIEEAIEKGFDKFVSWTKISNKLHPLSWKILFSESEREERIEPITAFGGLIYSVLWISTVIFGIIIGSEFFIIFGFLVPFISALHRILTLKENAKITGIRVGIIKLLIFFIVALITTITITGPISLVRVFLLILRKSFSWGEKFFSSHDVLRASLTILAILSFIISNILQIIATIIG